MNFHGLISGRTEWILRTDGSVVSTKSRSPFYKRVPKPVLTLTLGIGNLYAIVNVITATMLIYGTFAKKPEWLLPSLILVAADIVTDVSDAIIATSLIANYITFPEALIYSLISVGIICE
ncbi:hypothetical protein C0J52_26040 [Blattella germanica]|nr:hypothetical protein C0J52_26040 [Blattella germanica]